MRINEREVRIQVNDVILNGTLAMPQESKGIILFAHGSGSSRFSPRNRYVAEKLHTINLSTLLMDLLTNEEEQIDNLTGHLRFDVELLAERLGGATNWLIKNPLTKDLPIGYFGASTGSAAAIIAATKHPTSVDAIVSRGGRPDLAMNYLHEVQAPTLLIVGGNDTIVIKMNQNAFNLLKVEKKIEIVPNATHLFPEPGTLEQVAQLAAAWFDHYLIKKHTMDEKESSIRPVIHKEQMEIR